MKITIELTQDEALGLLIALLDNTTVNNIMCELNETNELQPNWENAPRWAKYWAVDEDGGAYWYDATKIYDNKWICGDDGHQSDYDRHVNLNGIDWKATLRERP
jgi:hypothetical protein